MIAEAKTRMRMPAGRRRFAGQRTPSQRNALRSPAGLAGRMFTWIWVGLNILFLLWLILSSLKDTREIFNRPWALPSELHWENYSRVWSVSGIDRATYNTVGLVAVAALTAVVVSAPAAYALSRFQARSAGPLTVFFALGMTVPIPALTVPLFVMLAHVGLVNSLLGLFVLYVALSIPFTVFLLTGFFRSLPQELEEAAALDGCSVLRTLWSIMLPLARPGLVTALTLNAVFLWSETFLALLLLTDTDKYTLSLSVLTLYQTTSLAAGDWSGLIAGVCIIVLPMLALYLWLGRRIIEGLTLGAAK